MDHLVNFFKESIEQDAKTSVRDHEEYSEYLLKFCLEVLKNEFENSQSASSSRNITATIKSSLETNTKEIIDARKSKIKS